MIDSYDVAKYAVKNLVFSEKLKKNIVDIYHQSKDCNKRIQKFVYEFRKIFKLPLFDTARLNENIELIIQNSLDEQMNICGWSWRYFYDKSLGTQSFKWDKVIITG